MNNKELDIPKSLELESFTQQQIISINGQQKTLNTTNFVALCPNCKTTLMQFNQGVTRAMIIKDLASKEFQLNYCIHCGQKLRNVEVIDTTIVSEKEINREESDVDGRA